MDDQGGYKEEREEVDDEKSALTPFALCLIFCKCLVCSSFCWSLFSSDSDKIEERDLIEDEDEEDEEEDEEEERGTLSLLLLLMEGD